MKLRSGRVGLVCVALVLTAWLVSPVGSVAAASPPPDTSRPADPANLRATSLSPHGVTLTWDPSTDDNEWVMYEAEVDASPDDYQAWAVADGTSSRRFSLLEPGLTYTASVVAIDGSGNRSLERATTRFTTPVDTEAPSTPTNLRFEERAGLPLGVITWDASIDNYHSVVYDVYATIPTSAGPVTGPISHPTRLFVSLADKVDYGGVPQGVPVTFFVRARDASHNLSPNSTPITLTL